MFNYIVEYLGTNYVGWQIQKNGTSIQSILQKALTKVLSQKLRSMDQVEQCRCSCKGQCANFIINKEIKDKYKFLNQSIFF